jgi:hypothetical protein
LRKSQTVSYYEMEVLICFYCAFLVGKSTCSFPKIYEPLPKESDLVVSATDSIHAARVRTMQARGGLRGICMRRVSSAPADSGTGRGRGRVTGAPANRDTGKGK